MPTAGPSMAQIVGLRHSTRGHHLSVSSAEPRNPRCSPGMVDRSARSVPAQKAPGTPVTMRAAVESSLPASRTASMNSNRTANVMALRFSGRSMVMTPIAGFEPAVGTEPEVGTWIRSYLMCPPIPHPNT